MQYGRRKVISEKHLPKLIVYNVEPSFDLFENDNTHYIDRLKPYAGELVVKGYISSLFPFERLKLFSRLYRNNYKILGIVSDCWADNGYIPLHGILRQEIVDAEERDAASLVLQLIMLSYSVLRFLLLRYRHQDA